MNTPPSKNKYPVRLARRIVTLRADLSACVGPAPALQRDLTRALAAFGALPQATQVLAMAAVDLSYLLARADRTRRAMEPPPKRPPGRPRTGAARADELRHRRNARREERLATLDAQAAAIRERFAPGEVDALLAQTDDTTPRAKREMRPALTQAALAGRYDFDPACGVLYRTTPRGLRNAVSPRTNTVMVDRTRYPVLQVIGVLLGIAEPLQLRDPTQPPTTANLLRIPK